MCGHFCSGRKHPFSCFEMRLFCQKSVQLQAVWPFLDLCSYSWAVSHVYLTLIAVFDIIVIPIALSIFLVMRSASQGRGKVEVWSWQSSKLEPRTLWILEMLLRGALCSSLVCGGGLLLAQWVGCGIVKWILKSSQDGDLSTKRDQSVLVLACPLKSAGRESRGQLY